MCILFVHMLTVRGGWNVCHFGVFPANWGTTALRSASGSSSVLLVAAGKLGGADVVSRTGQHVSQFCDMPGPCGLQGYVRVDANGHGTCALAAKRAQRRGWRCRPSQELGAQSARGQSPRHDGAWQEPVSGAGRQAGGGTPSPCRRPQDPRMGAWARCCRERATW
jgi:hypothetical protein